MSCTVYQKKTEGLDGWVAGCEFEISTSQMAFG